MGSQWQEEIQILKASHSTFLWVIVALNFFLFFFFGTVSFHLSALLRFNSCTTPLKIHQPKRLNGLFSRAKKEEGKSILLEIHRR